MQSLDSYSVEHMPISRLMLAVHVFFTDSWYVTIITILYLLFSKLLSYTCSTILKLVIASLDHRVNSIIHEKKLELLGELNSMLSTYLYVR